MRNHTLVPHIVERPLGVPADENGSSESLDLEQYLELLLGPKGAASAFAGNESRCWAWQEHSELLLSMVDPGSRPWGWWQYDAPEPPHPRESEVDYLARHGLLTDSERSRLESVGIQPGSQATRKP